MGKQAVVIGYVTCAGRTEARRVAQAVLQARLAACVSIVPKVESHYWWQDKLEHAQEWLLMIKTVRAHAPAVAKLVKATHGYAVPEILFVPVSSGERDYMNWLRKSVRQAMVVAMLGLSTWLGWADEVDELLGQLKAADEEQRAAAAEALTRIGGARVEQEFRKMLDSSSAERRQIAVAGLLEVSDAVADVERVRSRLTDADATVRWTAVVALGQSGWAEVIPWLEAVARTDTAESVRDIAAATVARLRSGILWQRSLPEALRQAAAGRQPVLVYFRMRRSPLCERFEEGVLRDAAVVDAVQRYVCVRLDVGQATAEVKRYDVRGVPALLLLDSAGAELARLSGVVEKAVLLSRLREVEQGRLTLREARRLAAQNPRDVVANWTVAAAYLDDGREELAEPYLRRVIAADEANRQGYTDDAIFALGFALGRRGEYRQAVFCMEKLLERWPAFKDRDKALYCLGLSQLALGNTAAGRAALEELVQRHPQSSAVAAAQAALTRLEAQNANR